MQTNFTPEQLRDPAMAVVGDDPAHLRPLRLLHRDLPDLPAARATSSIRPRGRIYLIKDMLEGGKPATPEVVKHIDRCLSCLVLHDDLPVGRALHAPRRPRARLYRGDLPAALARPRPALAARAGPALSEALPPRHERGACWASPSRGCSAALPRRRQPAPRHARARAGARCPPRSPSDRPGVFPAQGRARGRVAILSRLRPAGAEPGLQRGRDPAPQPPRRRGRAAEGGGLLRRARPSHGPRARRRTPSPGATSTPGSPRSTGEGLDAIVITASGCGTTIKDYGFMFRDDPAYAEKARRVSALAKDITEYLASARADRAGARNGSRRRLSFGLLDAARPADPRGAEEAPASRPASAVKDVPEGHICCGSAGTYNSCSRRSPGSCAPARSPTSSGRSPT